MDIYTAADIVHRANDRDFHIEMRDGSRLKGRLTGYMLKYPVATTKGGDVRCEISWALASRIAKGETDRVLA